MDWQNLPTGDVKLSKVLTGGEAALGVNPYCKVIFHEEIKNKPLGFFILKKSLELRLHYHFVTLKSGIAWRDADY